MKRVFRLSHMVLASVALVAAFLTMQGEATMGFSVVNCHNFLPEDVRNA